MNGKQGKYGGHAGKNRVRAFLLAVMLAFCSLGVPTVRACDADLIALIESGTASVSAAVPWLRAAHEAASLSDALNGGAPFDDAVSSWNAGTMALFESWAVPSRSLRTELGSITWRIQYLLNTGKYIEAHEALQRQFRLILQCLASLDLPERPLALAHLAGRVWSLVEAARDRDVKRFASESSDLSLAAKRLGTAWNMPGDSPLESVMHWSSELARVSAASSLPRDKWPEELLQAVSQLKNALTRLHGFLRTGSSGLRHPDADGPLPASCGSEIPQRKNF